MTPYDIKIPNCNKKKSYLLHFDWPVSETWMNILRIQKFGTRSTSWNALNAYIFYTVFIAWNNISKMFVWFGENEKYRCVQISVYKIRYNKVFWGNFSIISWAISYCNIIISSTNLLTTLYGVWKFMQNNWFSFIIWFFLYLVQKPGADPGFSVRGDEIRQGDLRVLLLLSQMFMERMMQES